MLRPGSRATTADSLGAHNHRRRPASRAGTADNSSCSGNGRPLLRSRQSASRSGGLRDAHTSGSTTSTCTINPPHSNPPASSTTPGPSASASTSTAAVSSRDPEGRPFSCTSIGPVCRDDASAQRSAINHDAAGQVPAAGEEQGAHGSAGWGAEEEGEGSACGFAFDFYDDNGHESLEDILS